MDACTQKRESPGWRVVAAHIPVRRLVTESTLLCREEIRRHLSSRQIRKLHVMLMHQNYNNPTKTILLEDIYSGKETEYTVEMPPRHWDELTEE